MRYFKILIIGFVIMLLVQIGILIFLEKSYLGGKTSYSSKEVKVIEHKATPKEKMQLKSGSENILTSYDRKYISYVSNDILYIANVENNEIQAVLPSDGMEISNYRWVYDRGRLIIAEKSINKEQEPFLKLFYYDIANKSKDEIFNNVDDTSIKIKMSSEGEKVSDIEMSTLTNVIYVKTTNEDNHSKLSRINIMAQKKKVNVRTHNIGRIFCLKQDDTLLYEDNDNGEIYKYGSAMPIEIKGENKFKLLGIDDNDNVYLSYVKEDKTEIIYYGNFNDNIWNEIYMKVPANVEDIFITSKGKVFVNDKSNSILNEIATGKETRYEGKIIGIYDEGIISINNDVVEKKSF